MYLRFMNSGLSRRRRLERHMKICQIRFHTLRSVMRSEYGPVANACLDRYDQVNKLLIGYILINEQ